MFFAGSQPIVTETCAPLDTAQQNVKKKTECKGTLGRMFDVDSANIVRTRTESRGKRKIPKASSRSGFLYGNLLFVGRTRRMTQDTADGGMRPHCAQRKILKRRLNLKFKQSARDS